MQFCEKLENYKSPHIRNFQPQVIEFKVTRSDFVH